MTITEAINTLPVIAVAAASKAELSRPLEAFIFFGIHLAQIGLVVILGLFTLSNRFLCGACALAMAVVSAFFLFDAINMAASGRLMNATIKGAVCVIAWQLSLAYKWMIGIHNEHEKLRGNNGDN